MPFVSWGQDMAGSALFAHPCRREALVRIMVINMVFNALFRTSAF
jgi:hypothetical protein